LVWSYVVVVDSLTVQNYSISFLHTAHDFVAFLECPMISFHTVIVHATLQTHA